VAFGSAPPNLGAGGRIGRIYWVGIMAMGWQWREVKTFLVEAWELFYWSLWCPSRLQERMNGIEGDKQASGFDLLLWPTSPEQFRFIGQYFLVSLILTIPTIMLSTQFLAPINWLIPFAAFVTPYGIGVWLLPTGMGWATPLLFTLIAISEPIRLTQTYGKALAEMSKVFPPVSQLLLGWGIGTGAFTLSSVLGFLLLKRHLNVGRAWLTVGGAISVLCGIWAATQNIQLSTLLAGLTGFFIFLIRENIKEDLDTYVVGVVIGVAVGVAGGVANIVSVGVAGIVSVGVASIVAGGVASIVSVGVSGGVSGGVAGGVASIVAGGVTVVVAGVFAFGVAGVVADVVAVISKLSLLFYLIISATLATGLAPARNHRWAIGLISVMLLLGFENLHASVLWAVPTILLCYYRIFPDYLLSAIPALLYIAPSALPSWLNRQRIVPQRDALALAQSLPRLSSELVWLPIPHHDTILADSFQQSPIASLEIYQRLQTDPLPGAQQTLQKALPNILANCLKSPRTTADLLQTQTDSHPQLPILIPEYYQVSTEEEAQDFISIKRQPEIAIIIPRLQTIVQATQNALRGGAIALRERALEKILNDTQRLSTQLPSLLPPKSLPRWQSVLTHWQTLLELELTEQRKLSQGELLSPFQFGNPLRPTRDDVFRGRRQLADRLYRLILDRDRPTLVLYGTRRTGKTSFLLNLSRFLPSDLIPIYLDMQSSAISNSEADFCYGITRAIHKDTTSQGLKLPIPYKREDFKTNPYGKLEDWLDSALPTIQDNRRLLLNLDEFEKIGSAIATGNLSLRLLDQLRNLIQHYDQLAFMFSGVQTLEELGPNWSSYFISVVPIEMGYLEPQEAEDLLRNPDPDFKMRYADGVIEEILRLTCCQPYLLQLIGSCLVTQANQTQTTIATLPLLQSAIPDAFTNGEPYFTNLWTEFTGTNPAEITAGKQILRAIAQNHPPDLTTAPAQAAHRRLLRFHLLKPNGTEIEIPLFQRWVIERAIDE
jgi:hypothetical protein